MRMMTRTSVAVAVWTAATCPIDAMPFQDAPSAVDRSPVQRPRTTDNGATRERGGDGPRHGGRAAVFPREFRTIDGTGNNRSHPEWGAADTVMSRLIQPDYADGAHEPAGQGRPSPRAISNQVVAQPGDLPNGLNQSKGGFGTRRFSQTHNLPHTQTAKAETRYPEQRDT